MFLSQATTILSAYDTQHSTFSRNLQIQRQLLASQQATLASLIASRSPLADIQSQQNVVNATQSNISSIQNSIKTLNDSKTSAQKVVTSNNTTNPNPNPFPQSVFTGVTGPQGPTGIRGITGRGPTGPAGPAGNLSGFDTTPILGSQKPVTSAGIYNALQNITSGGGIASTFTLPTTGTTGSLIFLKQSTFETLVKAYSASLLGTLTTGTTVSYWGNITNSYSSSPTFANYPIPSVVFTSSLYFQDSSFIPITFASTGFTIIAKFMYTGTSTNYRQLLEVSNTTANSATMNNNVFLGVHQNQVRLALYNGSTSVSSSTPILWGTVNPNQWTTIAITYDNTSKSLSGYQDGTQIFTRTDITPLTDRITTLNYLGRDAVSTSSWFTGSIAEVAMYSKCFTSSDIASYTQVSDYIQQRGGSLYICTSSSSASQQATWKKIK